MKFFIVLSCIISNIAGSLLITDDKSYDMEGENNYIWMTDGYGVSYLVYINLPVYETILNCWSGENNEYWVYIRRNPHNLQVIVHGNADTIWNTSHSFNQCLKIIVHGWNKDCSTLINPSITSQFIVVDWISLANSDYNTACVGILTEGQYLGHFLRWFIETIGENWSHVHVIGFSVGGDVASIAGCYAGGKPARVIVCANDEVVQEILQVPGDNTHYVDGESRYIWMPDGDGNPVLVDLHEPVDEEVLSSRNGAQNQYWLFTRRNPTDRQIITNGNATSIWNSDYLGSRPTKVVVHGWNNDGLDPAGPQWGGNANALNVNSGVYVEAIHTDGRALGIFNPIAHADFYPNGGMNPQPGCWISTCSHGRANDLFAASVRFNHLVGRRCINTAEAELVTCNGVALNMGNNIMIKSGSGIFGLRTGSAWPF